MSELDKLEAYLKENNIPYERYDTDEGVQYLERHQICVPEWSENCKWDAICHKGSYGYEQGLLEIYGELVNDKDGDSVVGYLTAEDVIKRIKARM